MTKNKFLSKLRKEGKLGLVEPSEDIYESYSEKSVNCLKSAKLLLQNKLYENSISMSYYAMYNLLTSLLFKFGIKCENHSASILLLKLLFKENRLFEIISEAKKERIDKQYYVTTEKEEITKETAEELLNMTEDFVLKLRVLIQKTDDKRVREIRREFETLVA